MLKQKVLARLRGEIPAEAPALPEVEAPPLQGLQIVVPPLPEDREWDEDDFVEAYVNAVQAAMPRRQKEIGEFAEPGDEVTLTAAFFHEGKALAFTAIDRETVVAGEPWPGFPGMGEGLVGVTVGELASIEATFPDDHEAEWLRGVRGAWRVRVHAIFEVPEPDWEDPNLLASIGFEGSLEAYMEKLREAEVASMAAELRLQAMHMALDRLRTRAVFSVPRELVEAELFERWVQEEAKVLVELGASESDLNLSLAAWLRDPDLYADAEKRVHISALLAAIAKRDRIEPSEEALQDALEMGAAAAGLEPDVFKREMAGDASLRRSFLENAYHLQLAEYVLSQASVHYAV